MWVEREISQMSERRETIRWKNGQSCTAEEPVQWNENEKWMMGVGNKQSSQKEFLFISIKIV